MPISRRELLRIAGLAAVSTPLRHLQSLARPGERRLFFDLSDLPRIRANAANPLLAPVFQAWRNEDPVLVRTEIERVAETRELLSDLSTAMERIFRETTLFLITGDERHEEHVRRGLEVLNGLPEWDYLREAGTQVIGLMRASKAVTCTLYAMEVLDDRLDHGLRERLIHDIAEKGCVPCALTIRQMNNPDEVVGWGVDDVQRPNYNWDMTRWPTILGQNNLRAIPTMGLGLGALALDGRDDRAGQWLGLAENSAKTYLGLFEDDGSYFEGISYVDFAFRTMFVFLEAHYRTVGTIDWMTEANFRGIIEYIVSLQNGLKEDGTPDVVNISDAKNSVFPCVPSWIARHNADPVAQYAAHHMSNPGFYADFLWYDPDRTETAPPASLLNKRLDLDWIITRTGWAPDDTVVAFRSGPPMNHEHADRNSIMVKAFGERILTDPFGASYDSRQPHWLLRKTVAHNAVLIDGQGHQYVDGSEGTNASEAEAHIISYVDGGDLVSWSSDATQAYRLVRPDVQRVVRSVLFAKPGLLILVDRLEMNTGTARLTARFHPDNRDKDAWIDLESDDRFVIRRGAAAAFGKAWSGRPPELSIDALDLPETYGTFPFVDVTAAASNSTTIVTALDIGSSEQPADYPDIQQTPQGLLVSTGRINILVKEPDGRPIFEVA